MHPDRREFFGEVAALVAWAGASSAATPEVAVPRDAASARPEPRVITGEHLRCVAMPLGGIGAGQIALAGDGGLRQWQIANQVNHQAHVPHSFFAIRVETGGTGSARVLQSSALYDLAGFVASPTCSDHLVPQASRDLLAKLPGVERVDYVGEYPLATATFHDAGLPFPVQLEAWSPCAPLEAARSAQPSIVFRFSLTNSGQAPARVALLASQQNFVGWDGLATARGVECELYGENQNRVTRHPSCTVLEMASRRLDRDSPQYGELALSTADANAAALAQYDDLEAVWKYFSDAGSLPAETQTRPSAAGRTWNGALASVKTLAPGENAAFVFVLSWHFPNRIVNWSQTGFGISDTKSKFWIGNYYNRLAAGAAAANLATQTNYTADRELTLRFHDAFYDSTLPGWLLDAVSSQVSILRSPTCLWLENGNFQAFEGCNGASTGDHAGGCCPLNCAHVWSYEQAVSRLFPELEQTMRSVDLETQQYASGGVPFRTVLPLYLPRWSRRNDGEEDPVAADGQFSTILKTYREYLQGGGETFLARYWPRIKNALLYAEQRWDPQRAGVTAGKQWNTYDCYIDGLNSFIGSYYLAALRATEEMARVAGEDAFAGELHARFEAGSERLDRELFNGEYYEQKPEAESGGGAERAFNYASGCMSDQLLGQWWAHQLGLGYLLPREHVRSAAQAIARHNFRESFAGFKQVPRVFASDQDAGLLICTWPRGGRPARFLVYSDEVWTGVEYAAAALMIYEGLVDDSLKIVRAARNRYDGRQRNPWNDIECGDHYARAMSSWTLLEAAAGFRYDGVRHQLSFAPRLTPENFRGFFMANPGWGTWEQNGAGRSLTLRYGRLRIDKLRLGGTPQVRAATVSGQHAAFRVAREAEETVVSFAPPIELKEGDRLVLAG